MRRKAFKTLGHNINRKMSNIKCSLGIQNDGQRNINAKCRTKVQLTRSRVAIIHSHEGREENFEILKWNVLFISFDLLLKVFRRNM